MKQASNTRLCLRVASLFLLVLIAVTALAGCGKPRTQVGKKTITVDIVTPYETVTKTIITEAEFLRAALEQEGLIAGEEGEFGLFVTMVNGITADESRQEWWSLTKGGEVLFSSVDTTPIADGEKFEITLTVGW